MSIAEIRSDHLVETLGRRPAAVTLWFFALTAMTLVFVALMLLGVLARRDAIDSSVGTILTGYTILVLCIGLFAFAYVLSTGRRNGLLAAGDEVETAAPFAAALSGLVIAPTVPPRVPLPAMRRPGLAPRRRAFIAAAPVPYRHRPEPSFPYAPTQATRPARVAAHVAPLTMPPMITSPTVTSTRSAFRPTMPVHAASGSRGPGGSPTHRGVAPVALQVRMAGLRSPGWDRPYRPTLADRIHARGAYRSFLPPSPVPTTRASRPMPQAVRVA